MLIYALLLLFWKSHSSQLHDPFDMAHTLKHLRFAFALAVVLSASFCEAQLDAVQIVANAALCFDNHAVMSNCLASMGINIGGSSNMTSHNSTSVGVPTNSTAGGNTTVYNSTIGGTGNTTNNITISPLSLQNTSTATVGMCSSACFPQMMLVLNCVDGILSNFQSYNPGLMQGVRAIFNMSCNATINAINSINNSDSNGNASNITNGGGKITTSFAAELHRRSYLPESILMLIASVWLM